MMGHSTLIVGSVGLSVVKRLRGFLPAVLFIFIVGDVLKAVLTVDGALKPGAGAYSYFDSESLYGRNCVDLKTCQKCHDSSCAWIRENSTCVYPYTDRASNNLTKYLSQGCEEECVVKSNCNECTGIRCQWCSKTDGSYTCMVMDEGSCTDGSAITYAEKCKTQLDNQDVVCDQAKTCGQCLLPQKQGRCLWVYDQTSGGASKCRFRYQTFLPNVTITSSSSNCESESKYFYMYVAILPGFLVIYLICGYGFAVSRPQTPDMRIGLLCFHCGHEMHHCGNVCCMKLTNQHESCQCSRFCHLAGGKKAHCGKPCGKSWVVDDQKLWLFHGNQKQETEFSGDYFRCPCTQCFCKKCAPRLECGCRNCSCKICFAKKEDLHTDRLLLGVRLVLAAIGVTVAIVGFVWAQYGIVGYGCGYILVAFFFRRYRKKGTKENRDQYKKENLTSMWEGWDEADLIEETEEVGKYDLQAHMNEYRINKRRPPTLNIQGPKGGDSPASDSPFTPGSPLTPTPTPLTAGIANLGTSSGSNSKSTPSTKRRFIF